MPRPNLFIIGAQKCGTSSLQSYLDLHPEIAMTLTGQGELPFFSLDKHWRKGIDWYTAQFRDAPVRGEKSVSYTYWPFHPFVPERIKDFAPDARFIYLVRDPIDRAVAGWLYHQRHGGEQRSLDEAFTYLDDNVHVAISRYATQLERYLAFFPSERFLVLDQHDLRHDRLATLQEAFRFLGVDQKFSDPRFEDEIQVANEGRWLSPRGMRLVKSIERTIGKKTMHRLYSYASVIPRGIPILERPPVARPELSDDLRDRLAEILAPEAARLRELTGKPFPTWSV